MFYKTYKFNQVLNNWDTSSVNSMNSMFYHAYKFNQVLNNWDVSSVTSMNSMFMYAENFNQPLNNWNVSKVKYMNSMFSYTTLFNQDIGNWNVKSVRNMESIFENAESFNYLGSTSKGRSSLSLWQIYPNIDKDEIKSYISDLTKDQLIELLKTHKPTLDGSSKANFLKTRPSRSRNALKDYKVLVDNIKDYARNYNIDLKSLVLRDLSLDSK